MNELGMVATNEKDGKIHKRNFFENQINDTKDIPIWNCTYITIVLNGYLFSRHHFFSSCFCSFLFFHSLKWFNTLTHICFIKYSTNVHFTAAHTLVRKLTHTYTHAYTFLESEIASHAKIVHSVTENTSRSPAKDIRNE